MLKLVINYLSKTEQKEESTVWKKTYICKYDLRNYYFYDQ